MAVWTKEAESLTRESAATMNRFHVKSRSRYKYGIAKKGMNGRIIVKPLHIEVSQRLIFNNVEEMIQDGWVID